MKTELSKITKDLEQGVITENEARTLLLGLLGVSGSFTADDVERAYDDGYQTEGEVNFDIENYR